jgi:hypothetical protein
LVVVPTHTPPSSATSAPSATTAAPAASTTALAPTSAATIPPVSAVTPTAPPTLAPGWTRLEPGGDTTCARGTPYAFWAHPGAADKLLIFFEGGGGCWDAATCAEGSTFFNDAVRPGAGPDRQGGIFDLSNPANPFVGWSIVYVAYCTGDVHWGSHTQHYPTSAGGTLEIHHQGFTNASAVLDWTYAQFPDPGTVFVTGCSAGAVGSAVHVPYISAHYPAATVSQLGDSLAFVYHRPLDLQTDYHAHDNFPSWIPTLASMAPGEFTMQRYLTAVAGAYPDQTFAMFNYAADSVQERFYVAVGGRPGDFASQLAGALAGIHSAAPNFRSYTAGGSQHCVLPFDRFYTLTVAGAPLRNWVAALAEGQPVEDVPGG